MLCPAPALSPAIARTARASGARWRRDRGNEGEGRKATDAGGQRPRERRGSAASPLFARRSPSTTPPNSTRAKATPAAIQVPAAVTTAVAAALASPLAAHAEVTPSLKNLLNSVIAGGVVVGAIVAAVTAVSGFDPVTRK